MGDKFEFLTSMILKVSEVNGRSNKIILGVLGVLLILGGIYWVSVLDKEQYLIKRNFRLLNLWSHEISNKMDSLHTVSALAFKELEGKKYLEIEGYLCDQPNIESQSLQLVLGKLCAAGLDNIKIRWEEKQDNTQASQPAAFVINLDTENNKLLFKIKSAHISSKLEKLLVLEADLDLSGYIAALTNEPIFENVLLISQDQRIIFQKVSKEYFWHHWQNIEHHIQQGTWLSFFGEDESKTDETSQKSKQSKLDLSPHFFSFKSPHGEEFTLFTQPIYLPGQNKSGEEKLYIAGIVSGEQFRQAYLSISSTALFVAIAVLLGLVVSLPFIRLKMMGSTDSLKSFHICILLFAMSLGSGLLTILFLDIGFFETGRRMINEQMEKSAKHIANQTRTELFQVLETLKYADNNLREAKNLEKINPLKPQQKDTTWLKDKEICRSAWDVKNCYPDYSIIYWMDAAGYLRENWTIKGFQGYETPLSLTKRAYVSNVLKDRQNLWHIGHQQKKYEFFLEPIISWSTGINRVVASMQSKQGADSTQVAALQFEFLSLMKDIVVPPGIGFVVVDDKDAKVLFHSSEQRALRENFLVETDNNQVLRDLIWAGESGHVEGRYWGNDTNFYVLPFDDLPWTLVVYRDREILSSVSLVALVIASSLFAIWTLIIYGVPWFVGWALRGRFYLRKNWLWPDQKYHSTYRFISIFNSILFVSGLCVFWLLGNVPAWLLLSCLVFSIFGLIVSFIAFRFGGHNTNAEADMQAKKGLFTILRYPYSFSTMISTYLLIFSVLPAVAITGAVYQKEMTTVVKYQLLKLAQTLHETAKPVVVFSGMKTTDLEAKGIMPIQSKLKQSCLKDSNQQYDTLGMLGFYPNFIFNSTWELSCPEINNQRSNESLFDSFYQAVSYYFIPLKKSIESWGLITNVSDSNEAQWVAESSEITMSSDLRTRLFDLHQPKYPILAGEREVTNGVLKDIALASVPAGKEHRSSQSISASAYARSNTKLVDLTGKMIGKPESANHPTKTVGIDKEKNEHNWYNLTLSANANLPIQSLIFGQEWTKHQGFYTYLLYAFLLCIWISFIYKVPQITANDTLFLFRPRRKNAELPFELKTLLLDSTPNLIVVGYPGQGKTQQLEELAHDKTNLVYLNLKKISEPDWINQVESDKLTGGKDHKQIPIVIIDQFDFRCNEPGINFKKLLLLEKILYSLPLGKQCRVHIISNVYPGVFPLSAADVEEQATAADQREVFVARWHKVLESFGLVYYAMKDKVSKHDQQNQWLNNTLGDHKLSPKTWDKMSEDFLRPHYQAIWQSVTLDEQLALYNLARDQFIHVKHPGLNSLLCKGLIKFSPDLRLMDPRFESFVKYAGKLNRLDHFAKKHSAGNWSIIKAPLGIIFIVFFAFLAITQEEFRSIFPALISILPVFFQGMPDLSQFFKGSEKS